MTTYPLAKDSKNNLHIIYHQFLNTRGVGRLVALSIARQYLVDNDVSKTLEEISKISDVRELDFLIGAGLRGVIYYAVVGQRARLEGLI